jgi:hypothetical protein
LEAEIATLKQMFGAQKEQYDKMVEVCNNFQEDKHNLQEMMKGLNNNLQHEKQQHNELIEKYKWLLDNQYKLCNDYQVRLLPVKQW